MKALFDGPIAKIYDSWVESGYYDYDQEAKDIARIIKPRKTIFELGIGTGNTAIRLAKMDFDVSGIDNAKDMLSILRKKLKKEKLNIKYELSDMRNYNLRRKFDVVLSAGGAFIIAKLRNKFSFDTYFTNFEDLIKIFKTVSKMLKNNGLFLINVQYHGEKFELQMKDGTKYWVTLEKKGKYHIKTHHFKKKGKVFLKKRYNFAYFPMNQINKLADNVGLKVIGFDESKTFYIFGK